MVFRVSHALFGRSALRPCLVVNPGGIGLWAATAARNNIPTGQLLPRAAHSSMPAVLLCVSLRGSAARPLPPSGSQRCTPACWSRRTAATPSSGAAARPNDGQRRPGSRRDAIISMTGIHYSKLDPPQHRTTLKCRSRHRRSAESARSMTVAASCRRSRESSARDAVR